MEEKKLLFNRIPKKFNEGMFWGNGCMGGLLYAEENSLVIAVDHSSLWETRDNGKEYKEEGGIWGTRLPGLSFSLKLSEKLKEFYGELDLKEAFSTLVLTLESGRQEELSVYLDSNVNVLKLSFDSSRSKPLAAGWDLEKPGLEQLKKWSYRSYERIVKGDICHVLQPFSQKGLAALSMLTAENAVYVTLRAAMETEDKDKELFCRENEELLCAYRRQETTFFAAHLASWADFWSASDIKVPSARLQRAYEAELYKIFCNERETGMPVTLMGIWNNDSRMPAWCGDLHNDMNVQACYWPVYKTNHRELGAAYIDYYAGIMPELEGRARKLYGIEDAIQCPTMMGPGGIGAGGGWIFWNCLLGPELFVAVDFIWYYEFTDDEKRLEEKIEPFLEKVLHLYRGIAVYREDGYLHIPGTNSPEVFKDGRMLTGDDATVVIANLHYILAHMKAYAGKLGKDSKPWESFDKELVPVTAADKGYPLFPGEELFESHRHFCQMFPVFPLGTDIHSQRAEQSLNAVIDKGFTEYAAWSFPYLAILAVRCGRGNMARTLLEMYCMAFCSCNTFAANGDPDRNGLIKTSDTNAGEPSDTFTLEAGFILAAAMSEMFVHRGGKDIYVAWGIPEEWKDCACRRLTVEGGHRISIIIENFRLKEVLLEAGRREEVSLFLKEAKGTLFLNGEKTEEQKLRKLLLERGKKYRIMVK